MAFLELVTMLPPGGSSQTRLARHGERLVVLRELKEGTACFYPQPSPGLVTLEEVGELQGKRHALFPYVPGVTLRDLVHAFTGLGKPVPLGLVGAVVVSAARALADHAPPRAHGGLTDAALQVTFSGETLVLDFGAPRITRFKPLGRESLPADVFALAGVLHAALTGYQGAYVNPPAPLVHPSAVHPEATPALDDVVLRALTPQLAARQRDVGVLADELEVVLGPLYAPADLAALIGSLFGERITLLDSLAGLTEPAAAPVLGDDGEDQSTASYAAQDGRPKGGIPMGTEPGGLGDGTNPGARLPWLKDEVSAEAVDLDLDVELEDSGTHPRIVAPASREEQTNPGVPAPAPPPRVTGSHARRPPGEGSRPTADRLPAVAAASGDTDAGPRAARPSASNLRAMAEPLDVEPRGPRASTPGAGPRSPRASAPSAAPPSRGEDAGPRAPRASGAHARPDLRDSLVPPEDTAPRARVPTPAPRVEDTAPRALAPAGFEPAPRNTTTQERLRAAGQERVATPPVGSPAVGLGDDIEVAPTAIRPRVAQASVDGAVVHAETRQKLKPVPAAKGGGRGAIAALLLVLAGLAAAWAMKAGHLPAPGPLAELLGVAAGLDAGVEETAPGDEEPLAEEPVDAGLDDDAGTRLIDDAGAAALASGGEDAGASDAGGLPARSVDGGLFDAGALPAGPDAGAAVDAGPPSVDAGAQVDAGVDAGVAGSQSKPPPKKKKRRR